MIMQDIKNPIIVLYESEDVIIIDKDKEVPVHGGQGIDESCTLLYKVNEYLTQRYNKAPDFIAPMHRIDMNTRGPVLFAKNWAIAKVINQAFSKGEIHKTYLALLEGRLEKPLFIQADILKNSHKRALVKSLKVLDSGFPTRVDWLREKDQTSKTISATVIKPVELYQDTTLCDVDIWTGRYHQIRAVSEAAGYPLCGDTKYNHNPSFHNRRVTNKNYPDRQMLLCRTLEVPCLNLTVSSTFTLGIV